VNLLPTNNLGNKEGLWWKKQRNKNYLENVSSRASLLLDGRKAKMGKGDRKGKEKMS
jgi:hypothetical protein